MKRILVSVLFVVLGSGLWWVLSKSHKASIKKWDAAFESSIRHSLNSMGFKDNDIVSSLNVVKKDQQGEWVAKKMKLMSAKKEQVAQLKNDLEQTGAQVVEKIVDGAPLLIVSRGNRVYQEISFQK